MLVALVTRTTSSNMSNTFASPYAKIVIKGRLMGYMDNKEYGRFIKQMK
jgi:hypothetical protein